MCTVVDGHSEHQFLSTLSLRRATYNGLTGTFASCISIHALLAESDPATAAIAPLITKFLSTLSLRRATRNSLRLIPIILHFYPRSPCGERQCALLYRSGSAGISIHALLAESDRFGCGDILIMSISIHALLAESDPAWLPYFPMEQRFLSTLSLRRATS